MSVHFGRNSQAAHRETQAREDGRQERAERAHEEGWDAGVLPAPVVPQHIPGDPFCECAECVAREKR